MSGFVRALVPIYGKSTNDPQNPFDDMESYALANACLGVRAEDEAGKSRPMRRTFSTRSACLTGHRPNIRVNGVTTFSNYRVISSTDPREFGLNARFAFGSR